MKLKFQLIILSLICGLNFFTNNQYLLPDIMEARNLISAREMVQKDNWFNPTMNNYPRLAKPPLPTWINGLIAKHFPVDNLAVHRIPNALIGTFLVFCIFFIARNIIKDPLFPFFSATIAASSYYFILMSRQATWDIYCHAFMTGAICFLIMGWRDKPNQYKWHIIAGILMGLSFLSKGPVAFYALLFPFLVNWKLFIDSGLFKNNWKGLLVCTIICIPISLAWPLYLYNINPQGLQDTIMAETSAWSSRHVRPFYQYWGFWSHVGIWTPFALAALYFPYANKRIRTNYQFLICWTIFIVVLLSIPGEKKERYLLPVLVPLSLLTGSYWTYLFKAWENRKLTISDKNIIRFTTSLLVLVCLFVPAYLLMKGNNVYFITISCVTFLILFLIILYSLVKLNLKIIFIAIVLLMTSVSLLLIPQVNELFVYKNTKFKSLAKLKSLELYKNKFYSPFMNPKQLLEIGKSVDTLHMRNQIIETPTEANFVIFSELLLEKEAFSPKIKELLLLDTLYFDPESNQSKYYLYKVQSK